jgi:hypothetical protein
MLSTQPQQQVDPAMGRRGGDVGQTVSTNVFAQPQQNPGAMAANQITSPAVQAGQQAPTQPPTQDELLTGLFQKAVVSNPKSKTFVRLPEAVRAKIGDAAPEGFDTAELSIAEKLMLRRMGVTLPAPRMRKSGATSASAQQPSSFEALKAKFHNSGGVASPYAQDPRLQSYREAWGQRPLLKNEVGPVKLSDGPYDPNGDLIIGQRR